MVAGVCFGIHWHVDCFLGFTAFFFSCFNEGLFGTSTGRTFTPRENHHLFAHRRFFLSFAPRRLQKFGTVLLTDGAMEFVPSWPLSCFSCCIRCPDVATHSVDELLRVVRQTGIFINIISAADTRRVPDNKICAESATTAGTVGVSC